MSALCACSWRLSAGRSGKTALLAVASWRLGTLLAGALAAVARWPRWRVPVAAPEPRRLGGTSSAGALAAVARWLFLAAARRGGHLHGCGADVAAPAQRRPVMGRRRDE